MLGGKEAPCVPDHYLTKYKKDFGRPCPRIELLTINEDAAQLVRFALNQYTQPMLSAHILTIDRTEETVREAMNRALTILSSKELHDVIDEVGKKEAAVRRAQEAAISAEGDDREWP